MNINPDRNNLERASSLPAAASAREHQTDANGTAQSSQSECCHGVDDVCVASGCLLGIPGGEDDELADFDPTQELGGGPCERCGAQDGPVAILEALPALHLGVKSMRQPKTEDEWLAERPPLWRLRFRWQWADRKPYTHTFTHTVTPPTFIPMMTSTERPIPEDGTYAHAWWLLREELRSVVTLLRRDVRRVWSQARRAARGR